MINMKFLCVYLITISLCLLKPAVGENNSTSDKTTSDETTIEPTTQTTVSTITTATTPVSTITTATTPVSTTPVSTITTATTPVSTTTTVTTPVTPTTQSTSTTVTTSTQSSTSTGAPPKTEADVYIKYQGSDRYCLVATMKLDFVIKYSKRDKKITEKTVPFNRVGSSYDGSCGSAANTMTLKWTPENGTEEWSLELIFRTTSQNQLSDSKNKDYALTNITFIYFLEESIFPGTAVVQAKMTVKRDTTLFKSENGKYYECISKSETNLNDDVTMDTSAMKVQAFRNSSSTEFNDKDKEICDADNDSKNHGSWIPLIVGIVLIVVVVVVLVLYIFCKNRYHARNYESVE